MTQALWQDRRTGKVVRQIGGGDTKEGFLLVRGNDNIPYYASAAQLMPCSADGTPDFDAKPITPQDTDEPMPEPVIDLVERRLNVNTATAEELHKRVPGITYRLAKAIKSHQLTLPGELYRTLEQLKAAGPRSNWEEIFRSNQMFVG